MKCFTTLVPCAAAAVLSIATLAAAEPATVLFNDKTVTVDKTLADPTDLWVTPEDLTKINGFTLKPEGACRDEICILVDQKEGSKEVVTKDGQKWFNLTAFAAKLNQPVVADAEKRVWSLGEVPSLRTGFLKSAVAPDFELPDRTGKMVKLSSFKGKKVLIVAWASWCGCRLDLPNWEAVYQELKDKNFEIVAVAQDTGGLAAAGPHYNNAKATYTTLIDVNHTVSSLYQMVNVPTGVWVDEKGMIVRITDGAYSKDMNLAGTTVKGNEYGAAVRDWVAKGNESVHYQTPEQVTAKLKPRTSDQGLADANFKLGIYFHGAGDETLANKYWEAGQKLNPEDWNIHRQDWAFTPREANTNWMAKVQGLNGQPYYRPQDLPSVPAAAPAAK